ncbi:Protein of unknown function, partial [Desulfatibacillum alkenivorans DSM 16219]
MRRYFYIFLAVIIPFIQAHALEPQATDFMSGARLDARADGGLWQLTLPQSIYEGLVRQDIGDIRILDGKGAQVPLKIVDERKGFYEDPEVQSLNIFPLMTRGDGFIDMSATKFHMDETGALIGVDSSAALGDGNVLTSYVLDASHLNGEPEALRLKWSDTPGKFVTTVDVKASRDLAFWFGLSTSTTLAQVPCGQMMFFQDAIDIPKAMPGYWLVTWPGGKKGSTLEKAEVLYPTSQDAAKNNWVQGTPLGTPSNGEYQFEIPAPLPASQVVIHVMWPDFCARAKIYSRSDAESNWEFHADAILYNLTAGEDAIQNQALNVRPVTHRYWMVQIDPESIAGAGPLPPSFQLAWTPHTAYFVAQGQEPYVIAFGSGRKDLAPPPPAAILEPVGWGKQGVTASQARMGGVYTLGGNNALYPQRPKPPDTKKKKMILAAAGVVAAALATVLALVAMMLLKQKKAQALAQRQAADEDAEWAEAQAAAETESLDDDSDLAETAAEVQEMKDSWDAPDQEDIDQIVKDSENAMAEDGSDQTGPTMEEPTEPEEGPALLEEIMEPEEEAPAPKPEPPAPPPKPQGVPIQLNEDGSMEQDQLDALLNQSAFAKGQGRPKLTLEPKKSPEESSLDPNEGVLTQEELDAMLAAPPGGAAALDDNNTLNQDDLDALLATQAEMPAPSPAMNDDGTLNQDALDALLATQPQKEPILPREPKRPRDPKVKANEDGTLDQAGLNALLANAGYNITVPTAKDSQGDDLPFDGALNQDQLDQIMNESGGPDMQADGDQAEETPVIKQFSQEELDDLFDGAGRIEDWAPPPQEPEPPPPPPPPVPDGLQTDGQLSQADLDAFFDGPAKQAPQEDDNTPMSQDDLDAMFDAPAAPQPSPPADDNAAMSQDELDAM